MMRLPRPAEPPGFEARVKSARERIVGILGTGNSPRNKDFADLWGNFKHVLSTAQRGRCGYCDAQVDHIGFGDVEHFRPKSAVDEISDSDAVSACARGRPPKVRR